MLERNNSTYYFYFGITSEPREECIGFFFFPFNCVGHYLFILFFEKVLEKFDTSLNGILDIFFFFCL